MPVTLCIETSSAHCSVALQVNAQIYHQHRLLQRKHNEYVLAMLDEIFAEAACSPRQVEVVGFGCGPGSFTGVRIAAAVTQAISLVADAQVVAMPGSQVWLAAARAQWQRQAATAQVEPRHWLTCVASRGQAYYLSLLRLDESRTMAESAARQDGPQITGGADPVVVMYQDVLAETPPGWLDAFAGTEAASDAATELLLVGQQPPWLPAALLDCWLPDVAPNAVAMLDYVTAQHAAGCSTAPELALPSYVSGDSPWKKATPG